MSRAAPAETQLEIELESAELARGLLGSHSENLKVIELRCGVQIGQRGLTLRFAGPREQVALAQRALQELSALVRRKVALGPEEVEQALRLLRSEPGVSLEDVFLDVVLVSSRNRSIAPKGLAQKRYVAAIRRNPIVFGIGPAGTGKTYLAMAMAVAALVERRVKRIILTRPAVEAGERLGFLPGDMAEKVNPYLRPLYDALHDMMDHERAAALVERGTVEVAPLAFMRGRTLHDAFVILDEAQNTTTPQMKMFLTRLGPSSRAVITGDVTQTDLAPGQVSGLLHAVELLDDIEGISIAYFTDQDVVRHPLVAKVIKAYQEAEKLRS